ncbi:helix-turn-helix domain-containing protein [Methylobacterium sp. E-066]|uniref:helix-turn-helix domain-containing protein n=1 Tax=Methylobacterium sp. E-066 TaxID=2836584 RepID=UPI001FBA6059|nr:XRE family transcriptional regulator [Methylobacterium sp. E-066]MCJ2141750.1 helix-turn-helix domain-containing protein [Methylobacterium sp. E-066]
MMDDAKPGTPVPLADILAEFSTEDQAEIHAHADQLIQESRTLAQFRRDVGLTQAELAQALETSQAYVAKLERNPSADMQVSTIARIASALGGEVRIVVSLPGKPDATFAIPTPGPRKTAGATKKASKPTAKVRIATV